MSLISPDLESRIECIKREIILIESWGYGVLNFDAVFKWANIIYEFHKRFGQSPRGLNILDIGGGLGPLDLYFTNFGKVINIDLEHEKTWFPTDSNGILVDAKGPNYVKQNLIRSTGDFFLISKNIHENFDFIYDSCSMIHLQRNFRGKKTNLNYKGMDRSILMFSEILFRLMHKESVFISATDMSHPSSIEFKEIISQSRIINSLGFSGFRHEIVVHENFYVDSFQFGRKKNGFTRSAKEALSKKNKQPYLMTAWPEKSVVNAKTVVGVFIFAKGHSSVDAYFIPVRRRVKNWLAGRIYDVLNPFQMKLRKVFDS